MENSWHLAWMWLLTWKPIKKIGWIQWFIFFHEWPSVHFINMVSVERCVTLNNFFRNFFFSNHFQSFFVYFAGRTTWCNLYTTIECGQWKNLYISLVLVHLTIHIDIININLSGGNHIFTTNESLSITFKV